MPLNPEKFMPPTIGTLLIDTRTGNKWLVGDIIYYGHNIGLRPVVYVLLDGAGDSTDFQAREVREYMVNI